MIWLNMCSTSVLKVTFDTYGSGCSFGTCWDVSRRNCSCCGRWRLCAYGTREANGFGTRVIFGFRKTDGNGGRQAFGGKGGFSFGTKFLRRSCTSNGSCRLYKGKRRLGTFQWATYNGCSFGGSWTNLLCFI